MPHCWRHGRTGRAGRSGRAFTLVTRSDTKYLDAIEKLNRIRQDSTDDPEIATRIAQYEMAFKMQTSVPGLMDVSDEPQHVLDQYGTQGGDGSFAANCLLARRLAERGVRFIQLYHRDWDHHSGVKANVAIKAQETDRATAALIRDLKQRGMLDDTIVLWTTEFGRMPCSQGSKGRDHNPFVFTNWLCGGGIKPGVVYGETDDYSYNIIRDPVHVHDFQATLLYMLGVDHEKLTFKSQGRRFRLTDVHGRVKHDLLV